MKKYIAILAGVVLGSGVSFGEDFNFVTTLSSPLAVFAQLETANSAVRTSVPKINYCTTRATSGTLTLQGLGGDYNANAQLGIQNGNNGGLNVTGDLAGNATYWQTSPVQVRSGGTLKVQRIIADTFNVNSTSSPLLASNIVADNALTTTVAKSNVVYVGDVKWFDVNGTGNKNNVDATMNWCSLSSSQGCPSGKTCLVLTSGSCSSSSSSGGGSSSSSFNETYSYKVVSGSWQSWTNGTIPNYLAECGVLSNAANTCQNYTGGVCSYLEDTPPTAPSCSSAGTFYYYWTRSCASSGYSNFQQLYMFKQVCTAK